MASITSNNEIKTIYHQSGFHLKYSKTNGKLGNVIFLHGLMSDMNGTKALELENYAKNRDLGYIRFDCRGHGQSSGRFEDFGIDDWSDDASLIIDKLTEGPQILIGSSMGGWSMLLAALKNSSRIAGLIGIAAAPDFTHNENWKNLIKNNFDDYNNKGYIEVPSRHQDSPYIISKKLIESGEKNLLLKSKISVHCPVYLLHGSNDKDVPIKVSLDLLESLESIDAQLTIVKNATHQFSEKENLELIFKTLDKMIEKVF